MVIYWADRRRDFFGVWVEVDGESQPLRHVGGHSHAFNWGYGGSGPCDLAISIVEDAVERGILPPQARAHVTDFKWGVVAHLPDRGWQITEDHLRRWWQRVSSGMVAEAAADPVAA